MYVLSVIRPPVAPAAFGRATVFPAVPYVATAAKRQARHVLETETGLSHEASGRFGIRLALAETGTLVPHKPSGYTFRIDEADSAPHPCPCGHGEDDPCGRLVMPSDHAYAHDPEAYCLGCFTWDRNTTQCLPANTAHTEEPPRD